MQRVFLFQKEDNELDGIHIDNVGKKDFEGTSSYTQNGFL